MRILILSNNDMGLYKFRKELLEALVREHNVFFSTPPGEYIEKIEDIGCSYYACNVLERRSVNPIKDIKLLFCYKHIIKSIKPDIVLTYTIKPNVYGGMICSMHNIPYISNITGLGTTIENGGLLAFISTRLYKIGLRKARCVFFQNCVNQELFVNMRLYKGKTRLIAGSGVNLDLHHFEEYPSDDGRIRLLFVGRIMKDKGIEELLLAIENIHKTRNDVILDVVGFCDENYTQKLNESESKGLIIYHGVQKDVHPYYKACHGVILPSYHEGMANVLLEASATGRPVIATNIPGCRETFDDGITGLGCEAKNAKDLENKIIYFLSLSRSERKKMGEAARRKMEKEFDRRDIVKAYFEEMSNVKN